MRKCFLAALWMCALAMVAGCIHVDSTTTVKKDGSAILVVEQLVDKQLIEMVQSQDGESPLTEEKVKESLDAMGEGMTLAKYESLEQNGMVGARVTVEIKDIAKLKDVMLEMNKEDREEDPKITFEFTSQADGTALLKVKLKPEEDKEGEPMEGENFEQTKQMVVGMMSGVKVRAVIQVDGEVVSTTAKAHDGNKFTLIDFDGTTVKWDEIPAEEFTSDSKFIKRYIPNPDPFEVVFK